MQAECAVFKAQTDAGPVPVSGKYISVLGQRFVVHRSLKRSSLWDVSDPESGRTVTECAEPSQEAAINHAQARLVMIAARRRISVSGLLAYARRRAGEANE